MNDTVKLETPTPTPTVEVKQAHTEAPVKKKAVRKKAVKKKAVPKAEPKEVISNKVVEEEYKNITIRNIFTTKGRVMGGETVWLYPKEAKDHKGLKNV